MAKHIKKGTDTLLKELEVIIYKLLEEYGRAQGASDWLGTVAPDPDKTYGEQELKLFEYEKRIKSIFTELRRHQG